MGLSNVTDDVYVLCAIRIAFRQQPSVSCRWWKFIQLSVLSIVNDRCRSLCNEIYKTYLVDPASSHTLVSKIKPCKFKYRPIKRLKPRTAH